MNEFLRSARPILRALIATFCAMLACAILRVVGLGAEASLFGGLIVAGGLNIAGLASLNPDSMVPTSGRAVGENRP